MPKFYDFNNIIGFIFTIFSTWLIEQAKIRLIQQDENT